MDWTRVWFFLKIARWLKKQWDFARREKHVATREQDVDRREKELEELIELRKDNIQRLPDLISLKVSNVSYSLRDVAKTADIRFSITNRSIFDVTLHKFNIKPLYEGQELADIPDAKERKITRQETISFVVIYNLQESTAKNIEERGYKAHWQFEMHSYFHSEFREFEKEDRDSIP